MPNSCSCNSGRRRRRRGTTTAAVTAATQPTTNTVVTERTACCSAPETLAEQFYSNTALANILMLTCCDGVNGCTTLDARTRCNFWPRFAHPRWLTCAQLHSRQIT